MGRPKKSTSPKAEATESAKPAETMSKAEAVRLALADGIEAPGEISEFVMARYGLELSKQMASSYKAQEKARDAKKSGEAPAAATRGPKPKAAASSGRDVDLLSALEALKPLIASQGAERLHRLIDVLK
jgi:hypothetical protein